MDLSILTCSICLYHLFTALPKYSLEYSKQSRYIQFHGKMGLCMHSSVDLQCARTNFLIVEERERHRSFFPSFSPGSIHRVYSSMPIEDFTSLSRPHFPYSIDCFFFSSLKLLFEHHHSSVTSAFLYRKPDSTKQHNLFDLFPFVWLDVS